MNNTKISRRSFLAAAGIAGAAAALTACGSSASSTASSVAGSAAASSEAAGGSMELIVFAAASLTETLTAIGEIYSAENPGVTFSFNFDSSGTLKTQIQEGADCDLFISAGQKQMNQLDSTASADVNTEGLDFVDSDSRVDLLENKVVLCVPENGDKGIDSFDSLAEHLKAGDILFCMGNSDVPVGQYTQKILAYYALDEEALAAAGVITYGSNVKEVTTQITEASVDAGVVYCTDAYSAGLTPVDEATKEMCGQVIYPAAVLKVAPNAEAAREFLAYLQTDRAATCSRAWASPHCKSVVFQSFPSGEAFLFGGIIYGLVSPLEQPAHRPRQLRGGVLPWHFCRLLYCQAAAHCQRRAGRGAHPAHGAAAHGGGLFSTAFVRRKAAAGHLFHGAFRREAGHELVQCHLCIHRGGLSADVPHGARRV